MRAEKTSVPTQNSDATQARRSSLGLFDTNPTPAHVLMPAYNANTYILSAIRSVFRQSHENVKLIIYDDGSTDGTLETIEKYLQKNPEHKKKIFLTKGEKNCGISNARRQLLKSSKEFNSGAYIFWLDADDQYTYDNFIRTAISQMQRTNSDICLFNFSITYEDESLKSNAAGLLRDKENHYSMLKQIYNSPDQSLSPTDIPDILKFTSLGWTKCYAPTIELPTPADCPFEDFVYMAALLVANKITVLPAEIEPIEYLRRSTSVCGQRTHVNFSDHIPTQLKRFFDVVLEDSEEEKNRLQRLIKAENFVTAKFNQYTLTLDKLIETGYPGITQETLEIFREKQKELLNIIREVIERITLLPDSKVNSTYQCFLSSWLY
jgi:hypothetical protein